MTGYDRYRARKIDGTIPYLDKRTTMLCFTGMSYPLWQSSGIPVCHTHYDKARVYRYVTPTMPQVGYTGMSYYCTGRVYRYVTPNMTQVGYTGKSHPYETGRVYRYVTPTTTQVGYTGMSNSLWHSSAITVCHTHYDTGRVSVCHTHYDTVRVYRYVTPTMTQVDIHDCSPIQTQPGIQKCFKGKKG